MDRNEAIEHLKVVLKTCYAQHDEAVKMAIEALNCSEFPNNSDTISRQAVTKFLNDWLSCLFENCHKQSASDLKMIIKDFKNLPSVQPERKTGRWIPTASGKGRHECSRCHEYAPCYQDGSEHLSTFCVLCGAKMERGEEE